MAPQPASFPGAKLPQSCYSADPQFYLGWWNSPPVAAVSVLALPRHRQAVPSLGPWRLQAAWPCQGLLEWIANWVRLKIQQLPAASHPSAERQWKATPRQTAPAAVLLEPPRIAWLPSDPYRYKGRSVAVSCSPWHDSASQHRPAAAASPVAGCPDATLYLRWC